MSSSDIVTVVQLPQIGYSDPRNERRVSVKINPANSDILDPISDIDYLRDALGQNIFDPIYCFDKSGMKWSDLIRMIGRVGVPHFKKLIDGVFCKIRDQRQNEPFLTISENSTKALIIMLIKRYREMGQIWVFNTDIDDLILISFAINIEADEDFDARGWSVPLSFYGISEVLRLIELGFGINEFDTAIKNKIDSSLLGAIADFD